MSQLSSKSGSNALKRPKFHLTRQSWQTSALSTKVRRITSSNPVVVSIDLLAPSAGSPGSVSTLWPLLLSLTTSITSTLNASTWKQATRYSFNSQIPRFWSICKALRSRASSRSMTLRARRTTWSLGLQRTSRLPPSARIAPSSWPRPSSRH